jgi:hypothetical protein
MDDKVLKEILSYNCDNVNGVVLKFTAERIYGLYNPNKILRLLYEIHYGYLGDNPEQRWDNLNNHLEGCDRCKTRFEKYLDLLKRFMSTKQELPETYQWYH